MDDRHSPSDEALTCLSALAASAGELHQRVSQFSGSLAAAATRPAGGLSFQQALPLDKRLAMMEQISAAMRVLARDGYRFRRMQARMLYAEGLTMAQLASVFGVSRQRVSVLLRDTSDDLPAGQLAAAPVKGGQRGGSGPAVS